MDDVERTTLYALRCVDTVELGTAEQIGIGQRYLLALRQAGYLNNEGTAQDTNPETFSLSEKGKKFMSDNGGPFAHRTSLRSYVPMAQRRTFHESAANGYNG